MFHGEILVSDPFVRGPGKTDLAVIIPLFEASLRFAQYAARTQQEYGWFDRNMETQRYDGKTMLGDMKARKITRQFAYSIYEQCVRKHGLESAKKMTSALRVAFKYGTLKMPGLNVNPISGLGIRNLPPRRQRWTDSQLAAFIKKADEMGFPSIGRCALMCMELVQRPGDMLSLRWGALREHDGVWYIHQSKRGVEVWVPPTKRLTRALNAARREAQRKARTRCESALKWDSIAEGHNPLKYAPNSARGGVPVGADREPHQFVDLQGHINALTSISAGVRFGL